MINKLYEQTRADMSLCIEDYLLTGALPTPIIEKTYGMLMSFLDMPEYKDNTYKTYISNFMAENYFMPKYGGRE